MGRETKVVRVKTQWGIEAEALGSEMGIGEVGVWIEQCNDHVVPWS